MMLVTAHSRYRRASWGIIKGERNVSHAIGKLMEMCSWKQSVRWMNEKELKCKVAMLLSYRLFFVIAGVPPSGKMVEN